MMWAAVSLWAGPAHLSLLLLVTALAGGILSLIILCRPLLQRLAAGPDAAVETSREVPYGIAIAVGGIAVASQLLAFCAGNEGYEPMSARMLILLVLALFAASTEKR